MAILWSSHLCPLASSAGMRKAGSTDGRLDSEDLAAERVSGLHLKKCSQPEATVMQKVYPKKPIPCFSAILVICFIFAFLPTFAFSDSPKQKEIEEPFVFRIGTIVPAGVSYMKYAEKALRDFEEATDGRVKCKLYAGGVLGDGFDMVKMVQNGELEGAFVLSYGLEKIVPEIMVLTVPLLLFDDEFELSYILDKYKPIFAQYALESGIEILDLFPAGCLYGFSAVPISGVADLKGKRFMCLKNSDFSCPSQKSDFFIPLSLLEVESALSSGKVDIVYAPPTAAVIMGWYPHIRSIILGQYCFSPVIAAFIANHAAYHQLPEKTRSMFSKSISDQREKMIRQVRRDNEIAMLGLMKRGVDIIQPTPEEIAEGRKASRPSWDWGIGKAYPRHLLEDILRDLEAYRASQNRMESKK